MARNRQPVRALVDACCLLVYITGQAEDVESARQLLDRIEEGDVQVIASPTILTEVLPTHKTDRGDAKRPLIRGLLESEAVEYVDLTSAIGRRAGDYMTSYSLDSMDAIHLATAVHAEVDALVTLNIADFPVGETVDGVPVLTPDGFLRRFFIGGSQPELDYKPSAE